MGVVEEAHGVAFDVADAKVEDGFEGAVVVRRGGGMVRHDDSGKSADAQQAFAGLIHKQLCQFIGVDGVAEPLNAVDEDHGDVIAVFFEEVEVLGDVDFLDEHGHVAADDFLDGVEGDVAKVAAGLGHDGDFVHGILPGKAMPIIGGKPPDNPLSHPSPVQQGYASLVTWGSSFLS